MIIRIDIVKIKKVAKTIFYIVVLAMLVKALRLI